MKNRWSGCHVSRTLQRGLRSDKSRVGSIAAHPFDKLRAGSCKKRKDGAPSVGMVHKKILKHGPPATSVRTDARADLLGGHV
jgi:hypothetical protein